MLNKITKIKFRNISILNGLRTVSNLSFKGVYLNNIMKCSLSTVNNYNTSFISRLNNFSEAEFEFKNSNFISELGGKKKNIENSSIVEEIVVEQNEKKAIEKPLKISNNKNKKSKFNGKVETLTKPKNAASKEAAKMENTDKNVNKSKAKKVIKKIKESSIDEDNNKDVEGNLYIFR